MKNHNEGGSNWKFESFTSIDIYLYKTKPLSGSSYFKPSFEKNNHIINVQNNDQECFVWAILAKLHMDDIKAKRERVNNYKQYRKEINTKGIDFPFQPKQIKKFLELNKDISVSIFMLEDQTKLKSIIPLKPYKGETRKNHVDVLLVQNEENSHYITIKDINQLIQQNRNKTYLCTICYINKFSCKSALDKHKEICNQSPKDSSEIKLDENKEERFLLSKLFK